MSLCTYCHLLLSLCNLFIAIIKDNSFCICTVKGLERSHLQEAHNRFNLFLFILPSPSLKLGAHVDGTVYNKDSGRAERSM